MLYCSCRVCFILVLSTTCSFADDIDAKNSESEVKMSKEEQAILKLTNQAREKIPQNVFTHIVRLQFEEIRQHLLTAFCQD